MTRRHGPCSLSVSRLPVLRGAVPRPRGDGPARRPADQPAVGPLRRSPGSRPRDVHHHRRGDRPCAVARRGGELGPLPEALRLLGHGLAAVGHGEHRVDRVQLLHALGADPVQPEVVKTVAAQIGGVAHIREQFRLHGTLSSGPDQVHELAVENPLGAPYDAAYVYVNGRPTVLVDPLGLFGWQALESTVTGGARTLGNLVRATTAEAGFRNPDTLSNVAKTAVWIFAVIIAVNQVGIAETLVNTLFTGAVAALSLAAGLAFGLGGRDLAARKLDDWYEDGDEGTPKLK